MNRALSQRLVDVLGWYGMTAVLGAYALSSFGVLQPRDVAYSFLNVTGAAGIVATAVNKRDYQPAVLNAAWCVIGLVTALLGYLKH